MVAKRGPTLRARWLGQQLRELRDNAGLTLRAVADHLQRDPSTISRMEQGIHAARVPDVLAYLDICGVTDERRRDNLVRTARDVRQTGWWEGYGDEFPDTLIDRIWLESNCQEIHSFQAIVLPGLLQTSDYAAALMHERDVNKSEEFFTRAVDLRLTRQRALREVGKLRLRAVIDESVLHREVGGRAVMREQLEYLAATARWDVVKLAVLPWSVGAHASPEGSFEILVMEDPYPDVGYLDTPGGTMYVEGPEVNDLDRRFDLLTSAALPAEQSIELVQALAGTFRDSGE